MQTNCLCRFSVFHCFQVTKIYKSGRGASTTCYVALSPQTEGVSGKYFADCNETNTSPFGK
ncbi:hypothetical protein Patl1_18090 [Pistacia atlantica]|uniref:Uncharacterized protein n=1 Tax=Pistacia atlantica TaxID=434234 RepID=A0ACC1BY01_9ROSI|nr:hypothetical protein Patl1_18090 [Pistacia atlantica]